MFEQLHIRSVNLSSQDLLPGLKWCEPYTSNGTGLDRSERCYDLGKTRGKRETVIAEKDANGKYSLVSSEAGSLPFLP